MVNAVHPNLRVALPRVPWVGLVLMGTVLYSASLQAQTLGRLFTTAEERVELDALRKDPNYGTLVEVEPAVQEGEPLPMPSNVTINGYVMRSNGRSATWVNGSRILNGDSTQDGIRLETDGLGFGTVRLVLPNGLHVLALKPGQRLDVLEGQVIELYQVNQEVGAGAAPMPGGYGALNWFDQDDSASSGVTPIE